MTDFFTQFHFLRPLWLLASVPGLLLIIFLLIKQGKDNSWKAHIDQTLLPYLLDESINAKRRWPIIGLGLAWLIAAISLAGPSWQKIPQPVFKPEAATVIAFDLSPSMIAEDVKPSRLVRTRFKLMDLLDQREEGTTALIAYAGQAHVVSPLTDDAATVKNLLAVLEPGLMPLRGSNPEMAIALAVSLFEEAGYGDGHIILATDGIEPQAMATIDTIVAEKPYRISVLGVGTDEGAPIPTGDGGFAREPSGDIVIAKLNSAALRQFASDLGGTYTPLTDTSADIDKLLAFTAATELNEGKDSDVVREFDEWRDNGRWLAIVLLPFVLMAFRKGWVLSIIAPITAGMLLLSQPQQAVAFGWNDLWWNKDQQGQKLLRQGKDEEAIDTFNDPDWKAALQYRNKQFETAADLFAQSDSKESHFNRGNALAKVGQYDSAIEAYDQALAIDEKFEDAVFNKALVEKIKQEQEKQKEEAKGENDQSEQGEGGEQSSATEQQGSEDEASDDSAEKKKEDEEKLSNKGDMEQQDTDGNSEEQNDQNASSANKEQFNDNSDSKGDNSDVDEDASQKLADLDQSSDQEKQQAAENEDNQDKVSPQNQNAGPGSEGEPDAEAMAAVEQVDNALNAEQQQALEQWLRQVPDDPGGLMRRKFEYENRQLRNKVRRGEIDLHQNQAIERW